jgi:diaminopimelate epimerase
MPQPRNLRFDLSLKAGGRLWRVHAVDTGVPHGVTFVRELDSLDIARIGRELRFHSAFGKSGANIDFVQAKGRRLKLRTYERGVEDETLACGTGVVAAAVIARALGLCGPRVWVAVRGGESLQACVGADARLEGPAREVFKGEICL